MGTRCAWLFFPWWRELDPLGNPAWEFRSVFSPEVFESRQTMQRNLFTGAFALVLGLVASPMFGQIHNGPLAGAVQSTQQAVEGAEHHAAGAAGKPPARKAAFRRFPDPRSQISQRAMPRSVQTANKEVKPASTWLRSPAQAWVCRQTRRVSVNVTGDNRPDQWRYRWDNGRWWYWTPQNRWMWYTDNGGWVDYDSAVPYSTGYGAYEVSEHRILLSELRNLLLPGLWIRLSGQLRVWWALLLSPGISVGVGGVGIGIGGYGYRGHRR